MTRLARLAAAPALLLLLAACADEGATGDGPATGSTAEAPAAPEAAESGTPSLSLPGGDATAPGARGYTGPQYQPGDVPAIYLTVQDGGSGPDAVIFAIDGALDGNPGNDQAVRIRPEPTGDREGSCGIENLQGFRFPPGNPVFSHVQANQGILLAEMPRYLAFQATQALVAAGLAADAEGTVAQNICTRKFWEVWLQQAQQQSSGASG
ncbi:MAG: hypothetical protein AAF844_01965 [Pseudomonadota bacterium]